MSAYIVDKNHITFLIAAALSPRINPHGGIFRWYHNETSHELPAGDYDRAAEVGNMLWRENIMSVSHRYPNESSDTLPATKEENFLVEPADFGRLFESFNPVQVLKSCHCYSYQSCEHEGWQTSEAFAFIESLTSHVQRALSGYDDAEWGAPEPMSRNVKSLSRL